MEPPADNQNPGGPGSSSQPPVAAPTDYEAFVTASVARMTGAGGSVDQRVLRQCFGLASSYLMTDASMDPNGNITSWTAGFNRLVDLLVVLHHRGTAELDTVNAASKACSESWSVAGNWRELGDAKDLIRAIAVRLKGILDDNGRTYRGERVYVP
ncbi:hypothetical protein PsYK624_000560 [Phanerochaete sordida]|uniref:Uncharacterized protein n=1 Tax=Phanerochaete sordida TaxID=48140 RepID=A0A9P3L7T8_9APHY|nr:hypothetical protein PsYK624_000560 [Phanerochaete sordida]